MVEYKNVTLPSLSQRLFEFPLHYRPVVIRGGNDAGIDPN
jgi:hypothetical protein